MPVMLSPDRLSLIELTPYLISWRTVRRISSGPGDDDAEIEPFMRNVRRRGIAEAADGGDLRTGGEIARSGEAALVDEFLGDDVEPRLGGRRAAAGGEAGVEHQLGHLHGDQHVLLDLHHLDRVDAGRVVPGQMQMRVDHAGHQRRAHAVDDRRAASRTTPRTSRSATSRG